MSKMDWAKVHEHDARRRNAPLRTRTSRFIMRATHAGICPACARRYRQLDPITPVQVDGETKWVHWTKKLSCAHRLEGRGTREHASR